MVAIENINEEDLKSFVKNRELATIRVKNWIGPLSKTEISVALDMSRPTLNERLKAHSWRLSEIKLILQNMPF